MHSPLFRYLDWDQSWMMQIAEVYEIQIDLNSNWLWHFRLINSFPAYHNFLLKHSLSKLSLLINAWTCLIFPTFSEITESPRKSHSISRILTPLVFAIGTKKTIRNIIFNYNQVTSDPDVRSSIPSSCSCAESIFLYPPAGHVVMGDPACILDKGLRYLFKKGPKYRLPSRTDFTKCRSIVETALQTYCKRRCKKEGVRVHTLNDCKNECLRFVDIRIENFTTHPYLYKTAT